MPIRVNNAVTTGGSSVEPPWVGRIDHVVAIPIDVTALTSDEVDENGYLKAGVPFLRTGLLVTAGAVYGCVYENTKVAASNDAADLAAAGSPHVSLVLIGALNRAVLEDNLGRALTAAEIAGFGLAGSLIKLLA